MIDARRHRIVASTVVIAAALALGACDTLADINPFHGRETLLPGERQAALPGEDPLAVLPIAGTAQVGAPAAIDWAQAGGNATNNPGNAATAAAGNVVWRAAIGGGGGGLGLFGPSEVRPSARPIATEGRVVAYDPRGTVSAFSAGNGGLIWRTALRPASENASVTGGGVAAVPGRVFAATGFRQLAALDAATGDVLWTAALDAPARSAPTASGALVIVVTQANSVYAVNQSDGAVRWRYPGPASNSDLLASASPAVSGNTAVVPLSTGEIVALDVRDGSVLWRELVTGGSVGSALTGLRDASASPVVSGGTVYATGVGGSIVAVNLATGARTWAQPIGSSFTPVVSGNALFMVDIGGRAVALDRRSGRVLWAIQLPGERTARRLTTWAGPVLAGSRLHFMSNDGQFVSVDAATGQLGPVVATRIPGAVQPIAVGNLIVAVGSEGDVVAFN